MASLTLPPSDDGDDDMLMEDEQEEESTETEGAREINMSNQSTTIDAAVGQSRIRQSTSLQQTQASEQQPQFAKLSAVQASGVEYRRVRCPPHRYTPLREHWEQILTPLVEYLKLQVGTSVCNQHASYSGGTNLRAQEEEPQRSETVCCSWNQNPSISRKPHCYETTRGDERSQSDAPYYYSRDTNNRQCPYLFP